MDRSAWREAVGAGDRTALRLATRAFSIKPLQGSGTMWQVKATVSHALLPPGLFPARPHVPQPSQVPAFGCPLSRWVNLVALLVTPPERVPRSGVR